MTDFNATASLGFDAHSLLAQASTFLAPLAPLNPQPVFHTYWDAMCARYSEYQIATTGSLLVQIVFYFGTAFPGFLFQFFTFMKAYKVQKNKHHSLADQFMCLRRVIFAKSFIYLPLIVFLYYAVHALGINMPYDYASMPAWYLIMPKMLFCLMVEDTWHYWAHRALHIPALYGPIHKLHHTFNIPFGLAAEYAHPVETIVLGVGFFLPLPLVCNHLFIFWCWLAVRMVQTTDVHSGFYTPWLNPMYLIPGYGGVRFHDFHHSYFNANYASTFTFWDWACGTDVAYTAAEEKRIEQEKAEKQAAKKLNKSQ